MEVGTGADVGQRGAHDDVKGAGFQWAGKGAIAGIHRRYPHLQLYQTEQECGDGKNDWRYCRYAWTLMKHYFHSGASAYMYWNIALRKGGVSRWGWAQNSLVTVDPEFYRPNDIHTLLGDATRARTDLGWYPEFDFAELVADMVDGCRCRLLPA